MNDSELMHLYDIKKLSRMDLETSKILLKKSMNLKASSAFLPNINQDHLAGKGDQNWEDKVLF